MDERRFDNLTRALAARRTRRGFLAGLAALGAGLLGGRATPARAACPPDQIARRGMGCVCQTTGRPPNGTGCPCPAGQGRCGDACVDLGRDGANCGACGVVCGADERCRGGACVCVDNGQACVGKTCDTAITNCGKTVICGPLDGGCPSGQSCETGVCTCTATACPAGCCDANDGCHIDDSEACGTNGGACTACFGTGVTCGGGGTPGVCGCTPTTTCTADQCGTTIPDRCGGQIVCPACTVTFGFTGGGQTWTVPAGVSQATFDLRGAQGGSPGFLVIGGLGGWTAALLEVAAGQTYEILVGGRGGADGSGGFNGGGSFVGGGGFLAAGKGGGGGASEVRLASSPLLVAGGGGGQGGGLPGPGGNGGGPSGTGGGGSNTATGGGGGTASAGGAAGTGSAGGGNGTAGAAGQGGTGGAGVVFGGGGGGGRGDGGDSAASGGGGSGFITPSALSVLAFETGLQAGNGRVTVTYTAG